MTAAGGHHLAAPDSALKVHPILDSRIGGNSGAPPVNLEVIHKEGQDSATSLRPTVHSSLVISVHTRERNYGIPGISSAPWLTDVTVHKTPQPPARLALDALMPPRSITLDHGDRQILIVIEA